MPFPYDTQVKIVIAYFLFHNFICMVDKDDLSEDIELEDYTPSNSQVSTFTSTRWEEERKTLTD
jgi:hypothetical protein